MEEEAEDGFGFLGIQKAPRKPMQSDSQPCEPHKPSCTAPNCIFIWPHFVHVHPQLGVVFPWLHPFILSGVISPLISSNILGTYWPGEFIFQCYIFLPIHTVPGVLKAILNFNMLGISELKWMGMGKSNSDDHYIYYYGQKSLRNNAVDFIVNKSFQNTVLESTSKMTKWSQFFSKANHSTS